MLQVIQLRTPNVSLEDAVQIIIIDTDDSVGIVQNEKVFELHLPSSLQVNLVNESLQLFHTGIAQGKLRVRGIVCPEELERTIVGDFPFCGSRITHTAPAGIIIQLLDFHLPYLPTYSINLRISDKKLSTSFPSS